MVARACTYAKTMVVVYFAVGPKSLRKACRSARSAKTWGQLDLAATLETMLVTDDATVKQLDLEWGEATPFDVVESIDGRSFALEFEATKPVGADPAESTAKRWRNRTDPANVALRRLRRLKIRSITHALDRYDRALFMDADTYVCKPLTGAVCGVGGGYDVAFVPVREGKEHAKSVLAASPRWRVPAAAREANTGVVAWANTTKSRALVNLWLEAYDDLLEQSGFLMDQPAFRAALHATGAKSRHLHSSLNCRGHDRKRGETHGNAAVPLKCAGFDAHELDGEVSYALKGGAGCVVLHSHDIREPANYPLYAANLYGPGWENVGSAPGKLAEELERTRMDPSNLPNWRHHPREDELLAKYHAHEADELRAKWKEMDRRWEKGLGTHGEEFRR